MAGESNQEESDSRCGFRMGRRRAGLALEERFLHASAVGAAGCFGSLSACLELGCCSPSLSGWAGCSRRACSGAKGPSGAGGTRRQSVTHELLVGRDAVSRRLLRWGKLSASGKVFPGGVLVQYQDFLLLAQVAGPSQDQGDLFLCSGLRPAPQIS